MTDPLDRLIAAGWGDVEQPKIPEAVRQAAERGGRVPVNRRGLVRMARLAAEVRRNLERRRKYAEKKGRATA